MSSPRLTQTHRAHQGGPRQGCSTTGLGTAPSRAVARSPVWRDLPSAGASPGGALAALAPPPLWGNDPPSSRSGEVPRSESCPRLLLGMVQCLRGRTESRALAWEGTTRVSFRGCVLGLGEALLGGAHPGCRGPGLQPACGVGNVLGRDSPFVGGVGQARPQLGGQNNKTLCEQDTVLTLEDLSLGDK